jgi:hypothetical protein
MMLRFFRSTRSVRGGNEPIPSCFNRASWRPNLKLEEMMKIRVSVAKILALFILLAIVAGTAAAQDKAANVAGSWTISVSGETGNAKQSMTLTQDGGKITGTFKGPRQSGTIDGTVDGNNIKFHVTAGIPLDYTGTVDGDSMSGTMSGRGKTGNWKATRAK